MQKLFFLTALFLLSFTLFGQEVGLDSSFDADGIVVTTSNSSSEITALAIQSDGKIIAVGHEGSSQILIGRYNSDGSLDNSFGTNGMTNTLIGEASIPYCIALQTDGRILVAGNRRYTSSPPFQYHGIIIRYEQNGTLDSSFGVGGVINVTIDPQEDMISSIALQPDGKILCGGFAGKQALILRLKPNGTTDNTFGTNGHVLTTLKEQSSLYSITTQPDGKILAAGTTGDITNFSFALVKYLPEGQLDPQFGNMGKVITDFDPLCYDIATSMKHVDEKILLAGYSECGKALFAKYNTDGSIDNDFGIDGKISLPETPPVPTNGLTVFPQGNFITCGSSYDNGYDFSLNYFNVSGFPDTVALPGGKKVINIANSSDYAQCLAVQRDGKIIVAGSSREQSSSPARFTLVRFTSGTTSINFFSEKTTDLEIYPNPFKDSVLFKIINAQHDQPYQLILFDLQGKEKKQLKITNELQFKKGDLAVGTYTFRLINSDGIVVKAGTIIID